jgi:hypothetical protein
MLYQLSYLGATPSGVESAAYKKGRLCCPAPPGFFPRRNRRVALAESFA